jgi:S-layer family protein
LSLYNEVQKEHYDEFDIRRLLMRFDTSFRAGLVLLFMLPIAAFAQQTPVFPNVSATTEAVSPVAPARVASETYGTTSLSIYTLPMYLFEPYTSSDLYSWTGNARYLTTAGGFLVSPVMLPAGARVESIQLEGCDTSATGQVSFQLQTCPQPSGTCSVSGALATGVPATPGCALFSTAITPFTIDNAANTYQVWLGNSPTDGTTRFTAVRLFYRLQISPDPTTATFADVPVGHPFHRFVEALVAAGITGGCGGGNYCPDAPVTRGQMAVFLSAALGLHWAP